MRENYKLLTRCTVVPFVPLSRLSLCALPHALLALPSIHNLMLVRALPACHGQAKIVTRINSPASQQILYVLRLSLPDGRRCRYLSCRQLMSCSAKLIFETPAVFSILPPYLFISSQYPVARKKLREVQIGNREYVFTFLKDVKTGSWQFSRFDLEFKSSVRGSK